MGIPSGRTQPYFRFSFAALEISYQFCLCRQMVILALLGGGRVVQWCWVNFQCRGLLLILIVVGQEPTAFAVGADGCCLDIFSLVYQFFFLSPHLWEMA